MHAAWLTHPILLDFIMHLIFDEKKAYKLWSSSLCNFLNPPVTSYPLGQKILLSTLFSNTPSRYASRK
jgi:hypothetical protein